MIALRTIAAFSPEPKEVPMSKLWRFILIVALLLPAALVATPAAAATPPVPGACVDGVLTGGAKSRICVPSSGWNGDLVIYAHGYTPFNAPLDFQNLTLPDGQYLPDVVQGLGYAFAATSYRRNGLAILEGVEDIKLLVAAFPAAAGKAAVHTYVVGVSEGGIITALLIERAPELFSGGVSACGPVGDFRRQVDYWTDFRVLFDYFFPGALPASPINIPSAVISTWDAAYRPAIAGRLAANPSAARQLIRTGKAAISLGDPSTIATTTLNLLWYNVFATNDGVARLGGVPFDNRHRWYVGSLNDLKLNREAQRFQADAAALTALTHYETSGRVTKPLVTLHTTGDEIIPFWHQTLYWGKTVAALSGQNVIQVPVFRYGHCNFTTEESLAAFGLLVWRVTGELPAGITPLFSLEQARADFERAQRDFAQTPDGGESE
jgi:pimeloyl-ACP methyl ester carboxylesterase